MKTYKKILLAVGICLVVLAIILAVIYFWPSNKVVQEAAPVLTEEQQVILKNEIVKPEGYYIDNTTYNQSLKTASSVSDEKLTQEKQQSNLKAIAISFAERYGSYSSEGNYNNIEELQPFMSPTLKAWAVSFVAEQRAKPAATVFYGVTTKALSAEIAVQLENNAQIVVNTQRVENKGVSTVNNVFYQKIQINLLKINEIWYVDEVDWLK